MGKKKIDVLYFSCALASLASSPMFLKRKKRKIKQRLFTRLLIIEDKCFREDSISRRFTAWSNHKVAVKSSLHLLVNEAKRFNVSS